MTDEIFWHLITYVLVDSSELAIRYSDLMKDEFRSQTHVNFPEKTEVVLKNLQIQTKTYKHVGRGKGKLPKKLSRDPRRLASTQAGQC